MEPDHANTVLVPSSQTTVVSFYSALAFVGAELFVRCAFRRIDRRNTKVRIVKACLGLSFLIKSAIFITIERGIDHSCTAITRAGDAFYHLGMLLGAVVLLMRTRAVIPNTYRRKARYFHILLLVVRFAVGAVDVGLLRYGKSSFGTCLYEEVFFWGPVYTFHDTLIDLYVTIVISYVLIRHIQKLRKSEMEGNRSLYTTIVMQNILRTVVLTLVNLCSGVLIIVRYETEALMIVWPIMNLIFVILIGYDVEFTESLADIQDMVHGRRVSDASADRIENGFSAPIPGMCYKCASSTNPPTPYSAGSMSRPPLWETPRTATRPPLIRESPSFLHSSSCFDATESEQTLSYEGCYSRSSVRELDLGYNQDSLSAECTSLQIPSPVLQPKQTRNSF